MFSGNPSQRFWKAAGVLAVGFGAWNTPVSAALIATESFETYSSAIGSNDLAGKNSLGTGWTNAWQAVTGVTVVDVNGTGQPTLSYAGTDFTVSGGTKAVQVTAGNENHLLSRAFAAQTDTVYLSMLLKQTAGVDSGTGTDFIQFGLTDTTSPPNIDQSGTFNTGNTTATNRFGARLTAASADVSTIQTSANIVQDQTYFLVLRVSKSSPSGAYDQLSFAVNPTSQTESSNTFFSPANKALTANDLTTFIGRLARMDTGDTLLVDEVRVGSDWASVVVPEPASLSMATLAGAVLLRRRSRLA